MAKDIGSVGLIAPKIYDFHSKIIRLENLRST